MNEQNLKNLKNLKNLENAEKVDFVENVENAENIEFVENVENVENVKNPKKIENSGNLKEKKKKPIVIVIGGPTASGKTKLSVELAKKINGEIISADSMQIYKDMDIGTAKVTGEEKEGIQHYLVDFLPPDQRYSVADFKNDAENAIKTILEKGKVPIVVGGTGLYINTLIYNINYPEITFNEEYRKQLEDYSNEKIKINEAELTGLDILYISAKLLDPKAMEKISPNDKKRILRIVEIYHATKKNKTELEEESRKIPPKYDYKVFAINWDREVLYNRINKRVDIMMKQGLVQEVENLKAKYNKFPTAMQGLGYKEVVEYLQNEISYDEMVEKIKQETRRYAKRQITWFKAIKDIHWLNMENGVSYCIKEILDNIE